MTNEISKFQADVNDNPPIFDHSDYIVSLNESVPPGNNPLNSF